ncbi:MAG: DegT/DnrJ/EryC1/StrS family aminotransferase [Planctomycetota bacterium]
MRKIPVYRPDLSGNETNYVLDCLRTGWISSCGSYVERFERSFAQYLGVPYCVSVSSGTAALQTAMGALGIGPGDEVIVPTLTYIAPANAVKGAGASVVFVDSLPDTWQMDPADVRKKITGRTKAIIAVHLYGGVCAMDELVPLAKEHNLCLIEDCAEAFGSKYDGTFVGNFGDVATFSFYGNKTITTGEGGMLAARSEDLYERLRRYKNQGLPGGGREYWHETLGFNYRMTNLSAAVGLAQLERADSFIADKRRIAAWYRSRLQDLPLSIQPEPEKVFHTYWMVAVRCADPKAVAPLRVALDAAGVETRPLFPTVHTMPVYRDCARDRFPVAEELSLTGINLPSWPGLTEADVAYIADVVTRVFGSPR